MPYVEVLWDLDDDPEGNVAHILEHGVSKEEVEDVLRAPAARRKSRSSGRPQVVGLARTGRWIVVTYETIDKGTVYPVTAYEVER
jgi:uncharacterized DUF497 family protein